MPEQKKTLADADPDLVAQWHPTRNGSLTPAEVSFGSNKKFWWKCPEGPDHEWQASPNKRTSGRGCPFCAGRRVSITNSLASLYPGLVKQWEQTKNGDLTPDNVTTGSHRKVWWKCPEGSDHEWQASITNRAKGRGCPFCAGKRVSVTNSLATLYPDLAAQWHPTKNDNLTPEDVASGAQKKIWWKCPEGPDHEWQAPVINRRSSPGCPFCRGLRASETNSLASLYPNVANQWHPTKNEKLTPDNVTSRSSKKVWWICLEGPDHEWQATISNRTGQGLGCPACSGRKASVTNSVAALFPDMAKEWHPIKNGDLTPDKIASGSHKKVWWKCPEGPDHEWLQSPSVRAGMGTGCPSCQGLKVSITNSLAALHPELAEQWHPTRNDDLDPSDLVAMSNKKVWWKCSEGPDHEWQAPPNTRIRSPRCPYCVGKNVSVTNSLATRYPILAQQWHPTKNDDLSPDMVTYGSGRKVWWKCPEGPDHEWLAPVNGRTGGNGCPYCRGFEISVTNSLAIQYPEVAREWHPTKNGDIVPDKVVAGSGKSYWWRCLVDNDHEWKAAVYHRTIEHSGCPFCNQGWTIDNIRLFVKSLQEFIHIFTPAELHLIFQQSGLLDTQGKGKSFAKAITTGRIPTTEIDKFIAGKPSVADKFIEDKDVNIEDALNATDDDRDIEDEIVDEADVSDVATELPIVHAKDALGALDTAMTTTSDGDAIDYLLASARAKLWRHALQDEKTADEQVRAYHGGEYAEQVRAAFLDEYHHARELPLPDGYSFAVGGELALPNLMQQLAAVTVRKQKRVGNWSGTGAGKTLSAVLASRVVNSCLTVICCPNSVVAGWANAIIEIFPDSEVQTKTLYPVWSQDNNRYLVLNYEMFQQPDSAIKVANFLDNEIPDFIVIDEIHYAKQRHERLMSKRKEMINYLLARVANENPDLNVLGMSATPVINNLREGRSLVEMITGVAHEDLSTKATVANCMKLHQKLVTLGIRWLPQYDIQFEQEIVGVDCTQQVDEIMALGKQSHNILGLEQLLTEARLPAIRQVLKDDPRPTLIYCHYITGIDRILYDALTSDGWRVGFFKGDDKSGLNAFLDGDIDILIGTAAIGTGVDGLQHVCDRLIINVLPWTNAEFEQLLGRIYRQGQRSQKVQTVIPITEARVGDEVWSWCRSKLARIQFKKSIADAAVDGIVPEGHLRTPAQAYRDLMSWLQRLEEGRLTAITRKRLTIPALDIEQKEMERQYRQYGDFSQLNNRWNQTDSKKTHERLQEEPEEWVHYHTLYKQARRDWTVVPYEEMIKWCQARPGYAIGDFGCGEAFIAEALADTATVYSFDHVAINDHVTACDISNVPLDDGELDVAIFSLSLMGHNFTDYLREAHRVLRLDGQLHIIESTSRFQNRETFAHELTRLGFDVISIQNMWKFTHIRAMKVERPRIDNVSLSF